MATSPIGHLVRQTLDVKPAIYSTNGKKLPDDLVRRVLADLPIKKIAARQKVGIVTVQTIRDKWR